MNRFIRSKPQIQKQIFAGFAYTYHDRLRWIPRTGIFLKRELPTNKVILLSGGGSGHEPSHIGYIGKNMLDGAIMGSIFEPPSAEEIFRGIKASYNGHGTILIIKNFAKDAQNFLQAQTWAAEAGMKVDHLLVSDDCSIESDTFIKRRRGVAGTIFVHKLLGAASEELLSLKQLKELGEQIVPRIKTLGVAFAPPSPIAHIRQQYHLASDELAFGIGIHGESGYRTEKIHSSERIDIELVNKLSKQFSKAELKDIALLVNGLGAIPLLELAIFMNDVQQLLEIEEIRASFKKMGNFLTAYDTDGLSLSFFSLKNQKWQEYLHLPTDAFGWH